MEDSSSDGRVIKAPTDRRLYRLLRLPNGLSALLVHDPDVLVDGVQESSSKGEKDENDLEDEVDDEEDEDAEEEEDEEEDDDEDDEEESEEGDEDEDEDEKEVPLTKKAAAALCVGIGSFSDPFEAQGLAHFLEHMLFMGSSEFPDENEYDSYLSKHGGSSNAYTETEYTCYYFEVNREYLKGALKRFSQFFISPLIKAEAMEREILAVDSEFNQVIQNDGVRLQQLQCHTSYPGHPFNRFFWGNKKSLSEAMERGINLREQILRLYRENYHGGLMKLVVIGGEPLDTLEDWVIELFGSVKEGLHLKVDPQKNISIWETGKIYRVEAVKDVNVLHLLWTLPPLDKEYLKKPEDYVAHLLGHEGSGSLLFFFKAKGWASSLSAGVGDEGTRKCAVAYIFDMSIHLTESGLEQVNEVVGVVYQYLKLLRQVGPQAWVFKELQDIGNMEFRFAEEQVQDDYAVELAENMLFYSEEHVIYGQYAFQIWDPKLVEHVLSFFTPNNMRIDLLSNSFNKESKDIQYEPWFGSPYIVEDIAVSLLEIWTDPPEVDPSLHLPSKNEFLPCDFSIRIANPSEIPPNAATNVDLPICLVDEPMMKLWYKPDSIFKVPRANTYFLITVKEGYKDVKNCVLTELFVDLLKDELNEILYQADLAKLDTSLSIIGDKIELRLYGFNDKLQALLIRILNISKLFSPTADRFKVIKEEMERSYRNSNMKPLSHSSYLRLQVLRLKFWDVDEKLACLTNLSLPDLKSSIPELLSQLHIEGLCHGNISVEEVLDISNIFKNTFSVRTLPVEIRHHENILCMPSGSIIMNASVKNKMEVNSVAELYFQIEQDVGVEAARLRAVSGLFDKIVEEPFFNQLRTKEQLGYTVESGPRMTYRVLGFCFIVQSAEYDPIYLHGRIDHFICGLQQLLDNLDDESFENYRTGLIEEKLEKDPSLIHETNHYWNQIADKRYVFDMLKKEAEELKSIQKSDIINFYNTYLRLGSPKCRILAIHMWGCKTNMKGEGETQKAIGTIIEDLTAFKGSTLFYPSLC